MNYDTCNTIPMLRAMIKLFFALWSKMQSESNIPIDGDAKTLHIIVIGDIFLGKLVIDDIYHKNKNNNL